MNPPEENTHQLQDEARERSADLLISDLDMATTLLDVASTSSVPETVVRNQENARKAYDTVLRMLEKVKPGPIQRDVISEKLALLKARLEAVGYNF